MKDSCEGCARPLQDSAEARSCSYGCTFCVECSTAMNDRCPNCGGKLEARAEVA